MTFDQFLWLIAVFVFGLICASFTIGYQCGKEDTTDPRNWERAPETNPYPADDDEAWARLTAAWDADDEENGIVNLPAGIEDYETYSGLIEPAANPFAITLESLGMPIRQLIPPRSETKRLADTGELRALAYAGDLDAIMAEVAAFTTELDKEDY